MSYDINKWKTKKLENLAVPFKAFFKHERTDWHPTPIYDEANGLTLDCGCGEIKGTINDGIISVTEISISDEGSGTFHNWILLPALEESTGVLEAVLIWECGDTLERLIVKDGEITEEEIEL